MLGNFSRYVRPGAVRHSVAGVPDGIDVLAFDGPRTWSVVVVNDNGQAVAPISLRLVLPAGTRARSSGAFQTSDTEDLAPVSRPRPATGAGGVVLVPSQSVTTYTFRKG